MAVAKSPRVPVHDFIVEGAVHCIAPEFREAEALEAVMECAMKKTRG